MRLPWNLYNETRDLYRDEEGKIEQDVTLTPSPQANEYCRELGISDTPIILRLIRIDLGVAAEKNTLSAEYSEIHRGQPTFRFLSVEWFLKKFSA